MTQTPQTLPRQEDLRQPVLTLAGVTKKYRDRLAVRDLSLEVFEREIFGFVGPNGAGKTTTIRAIATLIEPDGGEIRVKGHSVRTAPREVRRLTGYMPDFFGVYPDMQVWEYLDFFGACYRIPPGRRQPLVRDLLELVELDHRRTDSVDELSRGMKQRLSLARSLIHDPEILLLDEPASGLDPRARVEIRELLIELARLGKTIFFSTHILSDVAEICDRVGIIEAGELVAVGDLDALDQTLMPARTIHITVLGDADPLRQLLLDQPSVTEVSPAIGTTADGQSRVVVSFAGDDGALSDTLKALVDEGIRVVHFGEERGDLEDVFLRLTRGLVT